MDRGTAGWQYLIALAKGCYDNSLTLKLCIVSESTSQPVTEMFMHSMRGLVRGREPRCLAEQRTIKGQAYNKR